MRVRYTMETKTTNVAVFCAFSYLFLLFGLILSVLMKLIGFALGVA